MHEHVPRTYGCAPQAAGLQGRGCPCSPAQLLVRAGGEGWLLVISKATSPTA